MAFSEYFTQSEFLATQSKYDNTPRPEHVANLERLAALLDRLRGHVGRPIRINSGFRSHDVNREAGGSATSQHLQGEACDFVIPGAGARLGPLFYDLIRGNVAQGAGRPIQWGQLILYIDSASSHPRFVHISLPTKKFRNEVYVTVYGTKHYARLDCAEV